MSYRPPQALITRIGQFALLVASAGGCGLIDAPPNSSDDGQLDVQAPFTGRLDFAYFELIREPLGDVEGRPGDLLLTAGWAERPVSPYPRPISFEGGVLADWPENRTSLSLLPFDDEEPLVFDTQLSPRPLVSFSPNGSRVLWLDAVGRLHTADTRNHDWGTHSGVILDGPGHVGWSTAQRFALLYAGTLYVEASESLHLPKLANDVARFEWSPDGERIAWSRRTSSGTMDVFVTDPDDPTSNTLVVENYDGEWRWAPDSRKLWLAHAETGWRRVYVRHDAASEDPTDETGAISTVSFPQLSPDGQHYAYVCEGSREHQTTLCVNGTARTRLHDSTHPIIWAPDSSAVAFIDGEQLYVTPTTGGVIGPAGISPTWIEWSSDSHWIAFADVDGVFVADAETLATTRLSSLHDPTHLTWAPGDQDLLFIATGSSGRYVYRARLDQSYALRVSQNEAYTIAHVWQ